MQRSIYAIGFVALSMFACDTHPTAPVRAARQLSIGPVASVMRSAVTAESKIVSFEAMYGVAEGFVKHNPIRGVLGDELPWEIASAVGSLTVGGRLIVSVRGLVFADSPDVPPELRGINDERRFRALVSCLVPEGKRKVNTVNIVTRGFPATRSGDSDIDTTIQLPEDCIAPIIFVLSGSEDKWFSVMGAEISG